MLWSAGCASAPPATPTVTPHPPTPTATATPSVVVAVVPPALLPAEGALRTCAAEVGAPLAVFVQPQAAPPPPTVNFRLWWGDMPPEDWDPYLLGYERLVAVVHQGGQEAAVDEETLARLVLGQQTLWPGSEKPVALWLPLPGTAEDQRLHAWLGDTPRRGDASLAPTTQAMLQAVADDAAALGFLPAAWLSTHPGALVQALPVAVPHGRASVLALLPPDAPPSARLLVGCLQQGKGQQALEMYHTP